MENRATQDEARSCFNLDKQQTVLFSVAFTMCPSRCSEASEARALKNGKSLILKGGKAVCVHCIYWDFSRPACGFSEPS